jgi:acyl carrier protein
MEKLGQVIRSTFGLDERFLLTAQTRLKEIPGWDSMNSVNLELSIKAEYGLDPGKFTLTDETTLKELAAQLNQ